MIALVILPLTSLTFAIWVYLMFRTLMDQRRRAVMRTGHAFPGLQDALLEWKYWLSAPERSRDRWQLLVTTLILFTLIALNTLLLPVQATATIPT